MFNFRWGKFHTHTIPPHPDKEWIGYEHFWLLEYGMTHNLSICSWSYMMQPLGRTCYHVWCKSLRPKGTEALPVWPWGHQLADSAIEYGKDLNGRNALPKGKKLTDRSNASGQIATAVGSEDILASTDAVTFPVPQRTCLADWQMHLEE